MHAFNYCDNVISYSYICHLIAFLSVFFLLARVERMKEAKIEAEAAIAQYRAEMEAEYQANLNKVLSLVYCMW